ncbi:MAG: hypothetical protein K9J30_05830 [Bacteroidales bacterium]|nr:hypothetical protein [Bacteroidales bacterium]
MNQLLLKLSSGMLACFISASAGAQANLSYMQNKTPEYEDVISMYALMDDVYENAKLVTAGTTDAGKPLHAFIISDDKLFAPAEVHQHGKTIIMINNGIHPGECNGIDASIEFARELLSGQSIYSEYLKNTVVLIIPVFNIGGARNRSAYHRANQNGPELHGFRGNACNLDLNRDFVKMDANNTRSMIQLFHAWDPDIFIDTHSTNGADYPYTVTLIPSHHQQLEEPQAKFIRTEMVPELFNAMDRSPYKISHYVNVFRRSPEQGFEGFYQYPRYLSGYTSTFHALSFTVESHMLKPYPERVLSTKRLLGEMLKFSSVNATKIKEVKQESIAISENRKHHVLQWYNDTSQYDLITFTGYKAKTSKSEVTGQDILYYDRDDAWTDLVPFYNYFRPNIETEAPEYYIVPSAWDDVIERLRLSNIKMKVLQQDTSLHVEIYFIEDYQTTRQPYNGHYLHFATRVRKETGSIKFHSGDVMVPVKQRGSSFIVNTLEPHAYDSFFNWNFFDAILARKEYFSPYLFEKTAERYLEENSDLKNEFLVKKASDPEFDQNSSAQLRWIYERSPWSEPTYRRYPVYRYNTK